MKHHRKRDNPESAAPGAETSDASRGGGAPKRRSGWRVLGWVVAALVVLIGVARLVMPWAVRDYVNRTLDRNALYSGKIGKVHIHLWRGAYSIEDVNFSKVLGNVPVPFLSARRVDFQVQWDALLHGKIVGRVLLQEPELNFVQAPSEDQSQTGGGGPWLQMISDLFPFDINRAEVRDGSVHFRAFQAPQPVDVYLSHVQGSVDNLSNIRRETAPLLATVRASGLAMDQAGFDFKMNLDPFSYNPTFHLGLRLLGLDVTRLNPLTLAYGKFDFKRGWFDLVVEVDTKEGQLQGYIKPLFRDLKLVDLAEDVQGGNVVHLFWQALIGAATSVFKNQPRDQFGTLIPFSGEASGALNTDILGTVGNLLRNAFVRAYLPRLQSPGEAAE